MRLVERILLTLLKLLPAKIHALVPPQPRVLLLDLGHAPRLVSGVSRLVPPLRVSVDLRRILVRQGERVQRVVDTGRVEGSALASIVVQLGQVEASRRRGGLLPGGFGARALGLRGLGGFFGSQLGVTFGFLARGFGFLGFCVFPVLLFIVFSFFFFFFLLFYSSFFFFHLPNRYAMGEHR